MNLRSHFISSLTCAASLVLASLAFVACSDSETDDSSNKTPTEQVVTADEQETMDRMRLISSVLRSLTETDELTDDFASLTYKPTYGSVRDETMPLVRAVKVDSWDEAVSQFQQITGLYDLQSAEADGYVADLKLPQALVASVGKESLGTLTLHRGDSTTRMAYVDVNISAIPQLERIDFIPLSAWGDNGNGTSPFGLGQLLKWTGDSEGHGKGLWMCVRESNGPVSGVLVHLDEEFNSTFSHWYDDFTNVKQGGWMPYYSSTKEDVEAYLAFLYKYATPMQHNVDYILETDSASIASIRPKGFFVFNEDDERKRYLYKNDTTAAIVMHGQYGRWYWFRHYETTQFYQLNTTEAGSGSVRTVECYYDSSWWEKNVWNKYHLYTLSALHFDSNTMLLNTMTLVHDPAFE